MNHRVCFNGSPLDDRFDNVARVARRHGYAPALFGYTDQGVDPRATTSANDSRLSTYQGVLPGFDWVLDLSEPYTPWLTHLRTHGHAPADHIVALETEHERDESLSISTFLTDQFLGWHADARQATGDAPCLRRRRKRLRSLPGWRTRTRSSRSSADSLRPSRSFRTGRRAGCSPSDARRPSTSLPSCRGCDAPRYDRWHS